MTTCSGYQVIQYTTVYSGGSGGTVHYGGFSGIVHYSPTVGLEVQYITVVAQRYSTLQFYSGGSVVQYITVVVSQYSTLQWRSRSTLQSQWWLSSTVHYRGGFAVQYTIVYSGGSRSVTHYLVRVRRYSTLQVGPAIRHTTV